jgi:membrane protein DedA with SNARE-associated domain
MHNVPYRTFLKWNAAGGVVFSTIVVTLGYQFANSLTTLEKYLKFWAVGFLVVVVIAVLLLKRKLEEKIIKE